MAERDAARDELSEMAALLTADAERLSSEKRASELGLPAFKKKVRDAIFYFESTGFMMDRLDLSKRGQRQFKPLEESGICSFDMSHAPVASVG